MAFTNIWDNTFPPDTQAANQLGLDIRNLKLDISQRLSAMTGAIGTPPPLENVFAGMPFFDTNTGKVYQFTGTGFTEITPLILSNINEANTALQAGIVSALVNIPLTAPGPLVLATGAEVLTTPIVGDNTTKVATMAALQTVLGQSVPTIITTGAGTAIKLPLTYNSSGVPQTFATVQGGLSTNVPEISTVTIPFIVSFTTLAGFSLFAVTRNTSPAGRDTCIGSLVGLTVSNNTNTDTEYNWIAVGLSN